MLSKKQINDLKKIVHGNLETDVSLKNHTSFQIGGKAKVILFPTEINEIIESIAYLNKYKIKYYVFGLGTNMLVSDNNIDYVIIKLGRNFNHITVDENKIIAYSGASINAVCMNALNNNLTGLEDAFGIPGTIGGAVIMNASAYSFETKNVVRQVVALIGNKIEIIKDFDFKYRYSKFQEMENVVILQVEIELNGGVYEEIKTRMNEVLNLRKTNQPLNYPSAGSVFKRKNDLIVSLEIEKLGLKGFKVGGAQISEKHAGFIVNCGNAKCEDVLNLVELIKQKFKEKHNVELDLEIKYLGE